MPPVIVSPVTNEPFVLDKTTTPCVAVPPEVYDVKPEPSTEVVPFVSYD